MTVDGEEFMPFKSQAQRRKFAQLLMDGKISNETQPGLSLGHHL